MGEGCEKLECANWLSGKVPTQNAFGALRQHESQSLNLSAQVATKHDMSESTCVISESEIMHKVKSQKQGNWSVS